MYITALHVEKIVDVMVKPKRSHLNMKFYVSFV